MYPIPGTGTLLYFESEQEVGCYDECKVINIHEGQQHNPAAFSHATFSVFGVLVFFSGMASPTLVCMSERMTDWYILLIGLSDGVAAQVCGRSVRGDPVPAFGAPPFLV